MQHRFYDIYPKIVRADREQTITIKNRFKENDFRKYKGKFELDYVGADGLLYDGTVPGWGQFSRLDIIKIDKKTGDLAFKIFFRGEGEHSLKLIYIDQHGPGTFREFKIYSLAEDLFGLRPYRGDMHIHSKYSGCGDPRETPGYIAANARAIGLDFMALTDHRMYRGSREAAKLMKSLPTDFRVFRGEEVHPPDMFNLHIVNFGGTRSVSEYLDRHADTFRAEVKARAAKIPAASQPLALLKAGSDWCFDKIHEFNGLGIFCHPHWKPLNRFHLPAEVKEHIVSQNKYDAIEIVGHGRIDPEYRESNALSAAWWRRACIGQKRLIPVVGNTDSHNCLRSLGHNGTIIFAKSSAYKDLCAGIRASHSLAGEFVKGEFPHLFGDFRLVMFAYFLLREFYPEHDQVCAAEGALLLEYVTTGSASARKALAMYAGRIPALFKHYWA